MRFTFEKVAIQDVDPRGYRLVSWEGVRGEDTPKAYSGIYVLLEGPWGCRGEQALCLFPRKWDCKPENQRTQVEAGEAGSFLARVNAERRAILAAHKGTFTVEV